MKMTRIFDSYVQESLTVRGFRFKQGTWRLERALLPILIYSEKAKNSTDSEGLGLYFGGPEGVEKNGNYAVLQVGQRIMAQRSGGFFYDFSDAQAPQEFLADFSEFTLPAIDDFRTPEKLVDGLLTGKIKPLNYTDETGCHKAALDVLEAYPTVELRNRIKESLFDISRNKKVYAHLIQVAKRYPTMFPALPDMLAKMPEPGWKKSIRRVL